MEEASQSDSAAQEFLAVEGTAGRLLDTAERLFAEKGFAGTSVRQITLEAGANLASVSYHFESKEGLYQAVFERALGQLRDQRIQAVQQVTAEAAATRRVELVLKAFARAFVRPLMDRERGPWLMKLMMREMHEPQLPEGLVVARLILPVKNVIDQALRQACPVLPAADADYVMHALVGQLIHGLQTWNLLAGRSAGAMPPPVPDEWLEQVVRFTAGGIQALLKHCGEAKEDRS